MRKSGQKTSGTNIAQTKQTNLVWWEVKMALLLIFIVGMLVIGNSFKMNAARRSGVTLGVKKVWAWELSLNERLGVTFKEPWEMEAGELNRGRAVYNWLTKPGFRWLVVELGLGVAVIWMMAWGLSAAWVWQTRQLSRAAYVLRRVASSSVRVEIAGTVRIASERGLIYVSSGGEGVGVSGEEVLAFVLGEVKISIVNR